MEYRIIQYPIFNKLMAAVNLRRHTSMETNKRVNHCDPTIVIGLTN